MEKFYNTDGYKHGQKQKKSVFIFVRVIKNFAAGRAMFHVSGDNLVNPLRSQRAIKFFFFGLKNFKPVDFFILVLASPG